MKHCIRPVLLFLAAALILTLGRGALAANPQGADDPLKTIGPMGVMDTGDVLRVVQQARGKVVVLNFWASWCAPCRAERTELMALRKKFPPEDLLLLGLSVDQDPVSYARFVAKNEFNYPVRLVGEDVANLYNVSSIPRLMVYDAQGRLAEDREGLTDSAHLVRTVRTLLGKRR